MNERIKELAEQAGLEYNFDPMLWLKHEKFAELIVRECAQFCEDKNSKLLGTMLKEHFGVEE